MPHTPPSMLLAPPLRLPKLLQPQLIRKLPQRLHSKLLKLQPRQQFQPSQLSQ
jgi:hypothetical protein